MVKMLDINQALEQFLASVERRAFRMAVIATGEREEALDIVQDAMLSLVRSYSKKPEPEWRLLFFRILQNGIRDWGRHRSVRNRCLVWLKGFRSGGDEFSRDPLEALADPGGQTPAECFAVASSMSILDRALRGLPTRQQQAFLLRAWEGLSVAETASVMSCSEGTVKTHYSRAVHALREELGEYWP